MMLIKLSLTSLIAFALLSSVSATAQPFFEELAYPLASEICADGPRDLANMRPIQDTLQTFGGLNGIEGAWRLSGLAGVIAKVRVTIGYTSNYFFVRTDQNPPQPLQLCFSPETPDILRLRIPSAHDKQIALIFVKPGNIGQSIYVAAEKSNWKFHKFKRVTD